MWDLVWLILAVLAGLCIDLIIPSFCGVVLLAGYYIWVSEIEPSQDKYVGLKWIILTIIAFLVMWVFDFFPGRELTLFLTP